MLQQYLSDCDCDGTESECSESTVATEIAEQRVAFYNESFQFDEPQSSKISEILQVVNLHVDSVNIFGENEGKEETGEISLNTINRIIKQAVVQPQPTETENQNQEVKNAEKFIGNHNKRKLLLACVIAGMVLIVFSMIFLKRDISNDREIWVESGARVNATLPLSCIIAGYEKSDSYDGPLLIGRKQLGNELVIGKVIDTWKAGFFPKDGLEYRIDSYEVLCMDNYKWVEKDKGDMRNAINGGKAGNNVSFFVCRAVFGGYQTPGKLYLPFDCCYISYYAKEHCMKSYSVLVKT